MTDRSQSLMTMAYQKAGNEQQMWRLWMTAQHIPCKLQPAWAEAIGCVAHDVVEALHQAYPHAQCHDRALERRIKTWHLLPFLLLCKPSAQARIWFKTLGDILTK
eukprot:250028-Ditylum_brightwellii.AAC.1